MISKGYVEYKGDIGPIKAGWPDLGTCGDAGSIKAGWPDMGTCSKIGDGGDALMANTEWPPALMANTDWPPL